MKFTHFTVVVCAFMLTQAVLTQAAFAQTDQPIPIPAGTTFPQMHYHPAPDPNSIEPPLSGSTIPTWNYSVVSPIDKDIYRYHHRKQSSHQARWDHRCPNGDCSGAAGLPVQLDHKLHLRSDRC